MLKRGVEKEGLRLINLRDIGLANKLDPTLNALQRSGVIKIKEGVVIKGLTLYPLGSLA